MGVDYVLQKLGFTHARITIPKWIQRGIMDPCDLMCASIMEKLIERMQQENERGDDSRSAALPDLSAAPPVSQ